MHRSNTTFTKRSSQIALRWTLVIAIVITGLLSLPPQTLSDDKGPIGVPGVRGGVVTTSETSASQVGAAILRQGGNAIDAAAAVQFALNVVEPQSSGIGGGGFMLIHLAKQKDTFVIDCRESAPAAATPDMFVSQPSFALRSTSGYAVGVPGTLLCVSTALEIAGTFSLAETIQPAINMAEEGIRVSSRLAESILSSRLDSEPGNPAYDVARQVFRPGGVPLGEGDLLVQPDLANTFRRIADQGTTALYSGETANAIVATQLATRSGNPDGVGRMTPEDLASYQVAVRAPVEGTYRGYRVVSMPPPSSGGLTAIQILKLLERFPIGDENSGFGFGSTRTLNVMIEAGRLAFADRAVWIGDNDFVDVPGAGLLSDEYIAMRSALIDPDSRQDFVEPDDPRPFNSNELVEEVKLQMAEDLVEEGRNTTHFTIVDGDGNIVAYTSTIESAWGTGLMVPGFGFMLNNELTDFNTVPAFNPDPNNFNPGANDVAPGKRPRGSLAPTMIFGRDEKPLAAFGSPGGSTIIWSVANMALNLIDFEKVVQEAVDAPRLAQTSANGSTARELGFSDSVIDDLVALGHTVRAPSVIGAVEIVVIDQRGGLQFGAIDRRQMGGVISLRRD